MFTNVINGKNLEVSRKARKLFRNKKYKELITLLKDKERNNYLDSLYIRAQESLKTSTNTTSVKTKIESHSSFSFFDLLKKRQKDRTAQIPQNAPSSKQISETKKTEEKILKGTADSVSSIEKRKFLRERSSVITESSKILVDTLKKKASLGTLKPDEKKQLEKEIHEQEMKMAQNVQSKLLPKIDNKMLAGMDICVKSISCSELSGDVYDFITPNENETIFYIGDVTGHGTAAGLVMTMISCLCHSIIARTSNLIDIVSTLNNEIKPKLQQNMFTTMIMCKWHACVREFQFVGAGHENILHYHAKTKEVTKVKPGGIAVGMLADISPVIKEQNIVMENEDVLLLYTDGLDEAWNEEKTKMYGLDQIIKKFQESAELENAEKIHEAILNDIIHFQGKGEKTDDMSLMIFKRTKTKDEHKLKNDYEKKKLEEAMLEDEVIMNSKSETFNPNMTKHQNDFVEKSIRLAAIQIDEEDYTLARETLNKALRFAPENEDLKRMKKDLEKRILMKEGANGVFGRIKHAFISGVNNLFRKRETDEQKKERFLNMLQKEAIEAIDSGDIERVKEIRELMEKVDPKTSVLKRLEKAVQKTVSTPEYTKALQSIFNLRGQKQKRADEKKAKDVKEKNDQATQTKEILEMKKNLISFKKELSSVSEKVEHIDKNPKKINKHYQPSDILDKEDLLGLKKLIKEKKEPSTTDEKDIQDVFESISTELKEKKDKEESPEEKKEVKMQWEKGGVMDQKRKGYNSFMAKISPMNNKDLFSFIEKLSAFIKAGIPIQTSLEIMQEQAVNDGYIYVLDELNKSLDKGKLLSQAIKKFPQHFPSMLVHLIQAGEKSGALPVILNDIAEQMKEQQIVRGKIIGAMIYPSVIVTASLAIVIGMLVFIVPRLTKIYKETGVDLPVITQFIVDLSNYLKVNYLFVIGVIIGTIIAIIFFGKTKLGKKVYHKIYLTLPVVKIISQDNNVMLFASNMSILLENGVQMAEALQITAKITPNYYYREEILRIRKEMISKGVSLSTAMGLHSNNRKDLFPLEILQTVTIGEQTGHLESILGSSGEMFRERLKTTIKSLSELLEPFLILAVGLMVAVILLSIMLPLFNLGKVIRKT